jgi:hypothetical protein
MGLRRRGTLRDGLQQRAVDFEAHRPAEHVNLQDELGVFDLVFDNSLDPLKRSGAYFDADPPGQVWVGVERGALGKRQPDVLQLPLEPPLVCDGNDVGDPLGAVGDVGLVDVAAGV